MSNKSGTSSQIISLPEGGGALKGIGEKFSPDLYTGTGNFTIPIALPPGRNGFQPQLNLVYSTGNGNSQFGLGWSLSIPGISRKTSKGIPRYDDKDIFILSGAEDLVPVDSSITKTRYHPRTEGLLAQIEHHHNVNTKDDYWEVRSKDGLISFYGTPGTAGDNPAVIADPSKRTKVFAWKLSKTIDPFENRIEYEYMRDSGTDGPHQWDQLYLKQIRYADYTQNSRTKFLVSVTFIYDDEKNPTGHSNQRHSDPFSEYRSGFEIRTRKRCKWILIKTHADAEHLVRGYELIYLDERDDLGNLEDLLPLNNVSLLSQIKVIGYDDNGQPKEELPPLEFSYTQFEPEKRNFFPFTGQEMPPFSLGNPNYEMADLIGNGLPDILEMNGTVRYWRNLGNGRFDLPREMRDAPAGLRLADSGVQLIDADGDGRIDLLVTTESQSGYYPLRFGGLWDRRSFQRYKYAPSFNLEDPEVKLVDLDGDGITDVIRSGSRLECYFNDQHKGWIPEKTRWVERKSLEEFPNVNFSDQRVKWADMTGDGLQDIVLVYDGNIEYWPNLGYGNWGKRVHMENSPRFPYGYDPKRILIGDVDGDGLADIVYVDDTKVTLWINQSGNRWSNPIQILGTPPVSDMDAVRLADMLGSGISGVLWSTDKVNNSRGSMFFFYFTGGIKPYLLSEMNNHMGSVTRVGYSSSTQFYLEDQKQLATHWKTPLPFPVQVVACIEVIDEISKGKLTTEYRYHHGYWDGAEREFRGFGMVEQLDTETFEVYNKTGLHGEDVYFEKITDKMRFSQPTLMKTWFHQGPVGDEFGDWYEMDFRGEFWTGDPQVLTRPQSVINLLNSLPRRVKRDALRTLRGSILRTELYALDGTERQDMPYTVTESAFGVCEVVYNNGRHELRCEPKQGDTPILLGNELPPRIFFPHIIAQRTTQWERGDDPMSQFAFTDSYDNFGQPLQQTSVGVPRRAAKRQKLVRAAHVDETLLLATHTRTEYAEPDDDIYIHDRVAHSRTFELKNPPGVNETQPSNLIRVLNEQATAAQAIHQQFQMLLSAWRASQTLPGEVRLVSHTINHYDGTVAFFGGPVGSVGSYGALTRSESLVFTNDELNDAYDNLRPSYLRGSEPLPDGAPAGFGSNIGYNFKNISSSGYHDGYYVDTKRQKYDFHDSTQKLGMVIASKDPLGHQTDIKFDDYQLLPIEVTDLVGLKLKAVYDYRVMQPKEVTDLNENQTAFTFTSMGLLEDTYIRGKNGEGDQTRASVHLVYDFLAFKNSPHDKRKPICVSSLRYTNHDPQEKDEAIKTVEFSDGFGRLLQTRTQGEEVRFGDPILGGDVLPADQNDQTGTKNDVIGQKNTDAKHPNVIVSGWQIYDNKGRVVEKYEPFFSTGWVYAQPADKQFGQMVTMFYDPRGQVIRTVNPDSSEQRVIYGVPSDLTDPEHFNPTPWEVYTYDANDNAGRSHPNLTGINHSWDTPANIVVDALGRIILATERNRKRLPDGSWSSIEEYNTISKYDIQGNLLRIKDALERDAFEYRYDLIKRQLWMKSIDAGIRLTVPDALNNPVEQRDSKGAVILRTYDDLNRPIRIWARDGDSGEVTLRERIEYGDGSNRNQSDAERDASKSANRLGKPYKHYDEAGLVTFESYDFKGNILEKKRQVIADSEILAPFDTPPQNWEIKAFSVDWNTRVPLDTTEYTTTFTYDALNRIKTMRYPEARDENGNTKRCELKPQYNRGGALESVKLDNTTYVERIAYNAKGQRTLITYGNDVMTRYAYDEKTYRLVRMRTEYYTKLNDFTYLPDTTQVRNKPLQDFAYKYDLAGNILKIHDRTPGCGVQNHKSDQLDREFTYDPLYRLLNATGRQCDKLPSETPGQPWNAGSSLENMAQTIEYFEEYEYDPAGNIQSLIHSAGPTGHTRIFTRNFSLIPDSNHIPVNNRLDKMTINGRTYYSYDYDNNGNLIKETNLRHFEWDYLDRMRVYRCQRDGDEPSSYVHCLYDSQGNRVKKLIRNQGAPVEVTVYIDGVFEHCLHLDSDGTTIEEDDTIHVMDDQKRIALVRVGKFSDDTTPTVKYQLGDHLGSSNVVIDDSGDVINREEFTPYGETSFGSFEKKRYRFTGKERDGESGLYYHGARYYAPWLGRWVSCDPGGPIDGINLYVYSINSPIVIRDPSGLAADSDTPGKVANDLGATTQKAGEDLLNALDNPRNPRKFRSNVVIDATGAEVAPAEPGKLPQRPKDSVEIDTLKEKGPDIDWKGSGKPEVTSKYISDKAKEIADQQFTHMTVRGKSQTVVVVSYNKTKEQVDLMRKQLQAEVSARIGELKDALKGLDHSLYKKVKDLKVGVGVTTIEKVTEVTKKVMQSKAAMKALSLVNWSGKKAVKLIPGGSALIAFFCSDASAEERIIRGIAGEIPVGPIDLETAYDLGQEKAKFNDRMVQVREQWERMGVPAWAIGLSLRGGMLEY